MKKLPFLVGILLLLAGIAGCTDKDYITTNVFIGGSQSDSDSTTSKTKNLVSFYASIEDLVQTRTTTAFPAGRYATVFAYNAGDTNLADMQNKVIYKSLSAGSLSPIGSGADADLMYLLSGAYDFYAVSSNSTINYTPSFSLGVSGALSNGIDYLWYKISDVSVYATQVSVPITFSHTCAQIVLTVTGGENLVVNEFVGATLLPPDTLGTMSLATGVITPATALAAKPIAMGITSNVAQQIILPISTSSVSLPVVLTLSVNYETTTRQYTTDITPPTGGFAAGKSYLYEAIINTDTVTYNDNVNVIQWVPVDEKGNPLYPTQVK